MENRYESLFCSDSWEPSIFNKAKLQEANALIQQGSSAIKKGPCYHCGSTEHWANKCTERTDNVSRPGSTPSGTGFTVSWKSVPPIAGAAEVVVRNDRTFYWCSKCNRGVGRWNASHKTTDHKGPTAPKVNLVVQSETDSIDPSVNLGAESTPTGGSRFSFL